MPIELAGPGQYRGEGWLPGQSQPVYSRADGWTYFVGKAQWFYMPFIRDGGPTREDWQASGAPIVGSPPTEIPSPAPDLQPEPDQPPSLVQDTQPIPPEVPEAPVRAATDDAVKHAAPPPPPGWYADPAGGSEPRWFDGTQWTEFRQTQADPPSPSPRPRVRSGTSPVNRVETWWANLSPRLNGVRAVGVLLLALALLTRFAWWHEAETHYYNLGFGSSLIGGHVLRLIGAVVFALGGLVLIVRHPRIGVPPLPLGDWAIAFCATAVGGALFILGRAWLPADDSGTPVSLTFFALLSAPLWLLGLVSVVLGLRRAPAEVAFIKR